MYVNLYTTLYFIKFSSKFRSVLFSGNIHMYVNSTFLNTTLLVTVLAEKPEIYTFALGEFNLGVIVDWVYLVRFAFL